MDPDGDPSSNEDDPSNQIHEAYYFFEREIRDWATEDEAAPDEIQKRLSALRVTLSDLLKLVSIRLDTGDSPQVIFETLNARGTPLIALDLLKNSVFLAAADQSADTDRLYYQHWEPELDRDYWREDRRQGRLFTKNGDLFLMHWLVAELAEPVPATELFDSFKDEILNRAEPAPMTELIPRLCSDAAVMRSFDSQPEGSIENRFFWLLDLLDTTTMYPLALILFRSLDLSAERRRRALEILESFLVRRLICGWATKNYNRLAASLVRVLNPQIATADDALATALAAETAPANRWPRDDDVREVLRTKGLYGSRRRDRLVMVLWAIEERLRELDSMTEQAARPARAPHDRASDSAGVRSSLAVRRIGPGSRGVA